MKTRFLLALLTASALVPTVAMAQDRGERREQRTERRGTRDAGEAPRARGEFRGGAEARVRAPEPRPERPQFDQQRNEPQRTDARVRTDARPDRPQRTEGDRPRWQGNGDARPDRPQQAQRDRPQWQGQPGRQVQQGRPDFRRDFQRSQQGEISRERLQRNWQGDGRGNVRGGDRDRRDAWQREQQRQQGQRWNNDGGWDRSDRNWRDNDRFRGEVNDRRQWNRSWRSDDRYDWNRYRQSNRSLYRLPRYYAPQGYDHGYRRFGVGVRLSSFLFGANYWINDPYYYRLPQAYGDYRWVRYYNDALLVDVRSGQVVDVEYDIFW